VWVKEGGVCCGACAVGRELSWDVAGLRHLPVECVHHPVCLPLSLPFTPQMLMSMNTVSKCSPAGTAPVVPILWRKRAPPACTGLEECACCVMLRCRHCCTVLMPPVRGKVLPWPPSPPTVRSGCATPTACTCCALHACTCLKCGSPHCPSEYSASWSAQPASCRLHTANSKVLVPTQHHLPGWRPNDVALLWSCPSCTMHRMQMSTTLETNSVVPSPPIGAHIA
jgi:hypothetical protein